MKKLFLMLSLAVLSIVTAVVSCKKDNNDEENQGGHAEDKVYPAAITGVVYNLLTNEPLGGATVSFGNRSVKTAQDGSFLFNDVKESIERYSVFIEKDNYLSMKRFTSLAKDKIARLEAYLIPESEAEKVTFTAGEDKTVNLKDGTTIHFPDNVKFIVEGRGEYTGNVNMEAYVLDASNPNYSKLVPGGDQIGYRDGEKEYLSAGTGMMVELYDDAGQPLQLSIDRAAAGVTVTQAIPSSLLGSPISTNSVYYASLDKGDDEEIEEYEYKGNANKNSGGYQYTVGHFSFWSTQYATPSFGTVKCKVVDAEAKPISDVRVRVGTSYGVTNADGVFEKRVPTGAPIDLKILAEDFYGLASDKKTLTLSSNQEEVVELKIDHKVKRLQGTVVGCDGQPIPAQVSVKWSGGASAYTSTKTYSTYAPLGEFVLPVVDASASSYFLIIKVGTKAHIKLKSFSDSEELGEIKICD